MVAFLLAACAPSRPVPAAPADQVFACPAAAGRRYDEGFATRYDGDDPVRPAVYHPDKNLGLRGYAPVTDPNVRPEFADYGRDDLSQPPQFAALFEPPRVPAFSAVYRVNGWHWSPSPEPGRRGLPLEQFPVTALGLHTSPGEPLHVPVSGYDIGDGMEVLVLYADADSVTLRYTREDSSGSQGYTVYVDNLCTDRDLLALYDRLDRGSGPRYAPGVAEYNLPVLPAGEVFGYARAETVLAISDCGTFLDPRSRDEWWRWPLGD